MVGDYHEAVSVLPETRNWATACHLSAFAFVLLPFAGHILAPLAVWLMKRNESAFVDQHGKAALNFQLSFTIYGFFVLFVIVLIAMKGKELALIFGCLLGFPLQMFWLISVIMAVIRANDGKPHHYPLTFPFIS
jgi:uncharacterized Tic20 family protein